MIVMNVCIALDRCVCCADDSDEGVSHWTVTRCADFHAVQGRDLSEEAELHVRGHGHGKTLGVQEVGGHALRLQPHLVAPPWKP